MHFSEFQHWVISPAQFFNQIATKSGSPGFNKLLEMQKHRKFPVKYLLWSNILAPFPSLAAPPAPRHHLQNFMLQVSSLYVVTSAPKEELKTKPAMRRKEESIEESFKEGEINKW